MKFHLRGFEFLFELGNPRSVARRGGAAGFLLVLRLFNEANDQQFFASARNRPQVDAERDLDAIVVHPAARNDHACVLLIDLLDRRAKFVTHIRTHHGEQIVRGLSRRHMQISIRRP